MPTPPTAAEIKARFPEFEDIDDSRIEAVIEEAARWLDDTWFEDDYPIAMKYLVAHMMASEGFISTAGTAAGSGLIQSESLGDASISYFDRRGGNVTDEDFSTTSYGRRYLAIRRANVSGPVII